MEPKQGTTDHGKDGGGKSDDSGDSQPDSLRINHSLVEDDFPDFDPDSLEVDDWRDVFDDEDGVGPLGSSNSVSATDDDGDNIKISGDDSTSDSINSSTLMPPPPSLKEATSNGTTTTTTTTASMRDSATMPTTSSNISGIGSIVSNRPPLDHSITRRMKTAGTVDRRESAPPSWHSEAADLPHRQAMVQDIAKLLYARKKGRNPGRAWLERVPIKAKMLESQLYRNAASLEAYLNRSTLKVRLGKLASAITSIYKEAVQSRRGSSRSSSSSVSSLGSLENAFAGTKLRRESISSTQSLPALTNNRSSSITMSKVDNSYRKNGNTPSVSLPFPSIMRHQSDSILAGSATGKSSTMFSSTSNNNYNGNQNMMILSGNNSNFAGGNMGTGIVESEGLNSGVQQQFLESIRQQQQDLARRMSASGPNSSSMNTSAGGATTNMPMMAVGGNFPMLNQQMMMQQQNAMNMNLLQQQQNMLLQQQQQQQQQQQTMNQPGLSLHNITIMQQQQQRQMQQQQHPIMGLSGESVNNSMGMNMMNSNLSMVIPGLNANRNPQIQAMMTNQITMPGNNGMSNMIDMMNMPAPGMTSAMASQQRRSSTGNNPSSNNEPHSPLSPGSFNW
ncbi:hypothetical protein IV203_037336 [Nitzschia inconspicua]|uniref:Uncharacterized protein n=1 Tax=Nitzschia inconspicua TaxID=303405 RepID=A0A9K3LLP6_9STRA|nr:hypothetical protein IV203_006290 [Nitzschia inconspicua]KAG7364134.1 hypothetical protein IV203_037336 [Nitzschia inconspicua]